MRGMPGHLESGYAGKNCCRLKLVRLNGLLCLLSTIALACTNVPTEPSEATMDPAIQGSDANPSPSTLPEDDVVPNSPVLEPDDATGPMDSPNASCDAIIEVETLVVEPDDWVIASECKVWLDEERSEIESTDLSVTFYSESAGTDGFPLNFTESCTPLAPSRDAGSSDGAGPSSLDASFADLSPGNSAPLDADAGAGSDPPTASKDAGGPRDAAVTSTPDAASLTPSLDASAKPPVLDLTNEGWYLTREEDGLQLALCPYSCQVLRREQATLTIEIRYDVQPNAAR